MSSPQVATSSRNCSTVARSQLQWPSNSLAALTSLAPALLFQPRARCCRAAARCSLALRPPHWLGPWCTSRLASPESSLAVEFLMTLALSVTTSSFLLALASCLAHLPSLLSFLSSRVLATQASSSLPL